MAADAVIPIAQGGTEATTTSAARKNLHLNVMTKVLTTGSDGRFTITGLLPGNSSPIFAIATLGGGLAGWVMLNDPVKNQVSGVIYKPDGTTMNSSTVRIGLLFGTSWSP